MIKTLHCASALMAFCVAANADAIHLNPAQSGTITNMETFGLTSMPVGYYEYCRRYGERCARPADGTSVSLTRERWKEIIRVNNTVNTTVAPVTDTQLFGVEERWDYPKSAGDCEDYALEKRRRLNEMGYPLSALLMTVGRDADGGGHAVLTVVTDIGDFILDNQEPRVLLWRDAELTYLKRQSQKNPNDWVSLTAG